LLVRCSKEEAEAIREAARAERKTVTGFVLSAVLARISNRHEFEERLKLGNNATEGVFR